jgi:hypothetical protein
VETRNGHTGEALVLCRGRADDGEHDKVSAALAVVSASGVDRSYEFDAPFNSLTQSDDGRRVFLFFDPDAAGESDTLLQNQSEVAIVDLDAPPGEENPKLRTLDSFGDVPRQAVFSPPMQVAGSERELAVVLFDSDIAIWDMTHIDRPAYTVRLASGSGAVQLEQVIFGVDEPNVYLRGSASDTVFLIGLVPAGADRENDFQPVVNHLIAGAQPSDFTLYDEPAMSDASTNPHRLFVVASGSASALVVDTASNHDTTIPLPAAMSSILRFDGNPDDPERALLYREGSNSVVFVDLEGLEDGRGRNVEQVTLRSAYGRVVKLSETLALLIHQGQGLSLLDLAERTVQPMQSSQNLVSSEAANGKLWLAPAGDQRVGFLDLSTFHPSEVRLDAPVSDHVAVPSETHPRFVTVHDSSIGYVTALDADDPGNLDAAYSLRGFLVDDLLGGENR